MNIIKSTLLAMAFSFLCATPTVAGITDYQSMPEMVQRIMNVPEPSDGIPGPKGKRLLLVRHGNLLSVEDLARPTIGLAGISIDPKSNSTRPLDLGVALEVYDLESGKMRSVADLPEKYGFSHVSWSPTGNHIGMVVYGEGELELWVVDLKSMKANQLTELQLNDVLGVPYRWHPDGKSIIGLTVPEDRGEKPETAKHRFGPKIRDSAGPAIPARTYQNLLQSGYDVLLFEYLGRSQIVEIELDGDYRPIDIPAMYKKAVPSPDGKYLLTERIHRPYSYLFPADRFPYRVEITDMSGNEVRKIDDLKLANNVPFGRWGVRTGARHTAWNPAAPAEVWWVEAQDLGYIKKDAPIRDEVFSLAAPFEDEPTSRLAMSHRFQATYWGEKVAIVIGTNTETGQFQAWFVGPEKTDDQQLVLGWKQLGKGKLKPIVLSEDGPFKQYRLSPDKKKIYLTGRDTSQPKDHDTLVTMNLATGASETLWLGDPESEENILLPMDKDDKTWLVRSQSFTEPPNYFIRKQDNSDVKAVTDFTHPVPPLKYVKKVRIEYEREDGVKLAGNLYLPPDHTEESGPIPVLIWIYPREYKNKSAAENAISNPKSFMSLGRRSRMFWPLMGYGLLDNPTFPIIGSDEGLPNDTFLAQLGANGKAAIDELVRLGITTPNKVAVGGHSYGAFATANLLAHTNLFNAGIARSGAYNRSLTPFGFQKEHRSFWNEPELYQKMSPFFYVSNLNSPILLIHGEQDQNAGTFPEQSERFYQALVGLGKTARLVMLPHEDHSYYGKESIFHMIWEMKRWLDIHLLGETEGHDQ